MGIEEAFVSRINANADAQEILEGRVYASSASPGAEPPVVIYTKVSSDRKRDLSGKARLAITRMQLDCYSGEYEEAKTISRLIIEDFDSFKGIVAGVNVLACWVDSEEDIYEGDPGLYRTSMDFMIWHSL